MASDWQERSISELCSFIVDCVNKTAPKVEYKTPYKMLRTTNIRHGLVNLQDCQYVEKDIFEKWTRRASVLKGDVILTREAPLGEVGRVGADDTVFLGQRLMQYRANENILDSRFLLYSFLSPYLQQQFKIHEGTGSVVSHIRVPDCLKFKLKLPPLPEQKAIAHILGSLDDKIELNRQMNATLEAMAQALFKSWFVDFDPVIDNALAAGNPIPDELEVKAAARQTLGDARKPLPEDIRSLFPNAFVFTEEMGWIPEGWEVNSYSAIAKLNPESWTNKNAPDNISYVDLSNTKNGRITQSVSYSFSDAPSRARRILKPDDTILGTVRPGNRSFAYVFLDSLTGSTGFAVMRPKKQHHRAFIYLGLTQKDTIDYFAHIADGGAYPAIRPEVVADYTAALPINDDIFKAFDNLAYPWLNSIGINEKVSDGCSQLRDTLLPKLLSGELRIPEAAELVEEAIA
jgi:type I restriction enzyme S subunit